MNFCCIFVLFHGHAHLLFTYLRFLPLPPAQFFFLVVVVLSLVFTGVILVLFLLTVPFFPLAFVSGSGDDKGVAVLSPHTAVPFARLLGVDAPQSSKTKMDIQTS